MNYTIRDFWLAKLPHLVRPTKQLSFVGWSAESSTNESFVEAPLTLREDYQNLAAPVWFIAAPGAVGKSTLAREIAANSKAIYLDLAKAATVAGNYLVGGLVNNGLWDLWRQNQTAILIDALDEARLRVTQSSFVDFLRDVEVQSRGRSVPTILLGRVGIVDEAWLILSESNLECPIFDIGFFDNKSAERFVLASLSRLARKPDNRRLKASLGSHLSNYEAAISSFVQKLSETTASDGAKFSGYAPVLDAVARVLEGTANPTTLNDAVQNALQGQVLQQLTNTLLERESEKLRGQLQSLIPAPIRSQLYSPEEQLARLAAVVLGAQQPPLPKSLQPDQVAPYDQAVKSLLSQHPFLDGTGTRPSSAVFAAAINAYGLFSPSDGVRTLALDNAGNGPNTPNPFLVDFYLYRAQSGKQYRVVDPEHIVVIYESIGARASAGDVVRLTVEGDDDSDRADVEITVSTNGADGRDQIIYLESSQAGTIKFGRRVSGTTIECPLIDVQIGSGNPVEFVAPISIDVARINFKCPEIVVLSGDKSSDSYDKSVAMEAKELTESRVVNPPTIRRPAELSVRWPGASEYPWTHHSRPTSAGVAPQNEEALRALRRLVMAFRSHSRGRLARIQDKIEHSRMTKGKIGLAIRERLLNDGALYKEDNMYFLDPDKLGQVVGANYQDLKLKKYNQQVQRYVASITEG